MAGPVGSRSVETRLRALQDHAQHRGRIPGLDGRCFRQVRKQARHALAILRMAGRAEVLIDRAACGEDVLVGRPGIVLCGTGCVLQIGGDRIEVGIRQFRGREIDHLAHQAGSRGIPVVTGLQVGRDILGRPVAQRALAACDVGRDPALQRIALQRFGWLVAAEKRLRRVAGAAMVRALHEIGAAIPFLRIWTRRA